MMTSGASAMITVAMTDWVDYSAAARARQEGIFPTVSGIAIILYTSQDSKADLFLFFNIDQADLFQL